MCVCVYVYVCPPLQFTHMLDILEDYCFMRGFKYCRIDGDTVRRSLVAIYCSVLVVLLLLFAVCWLLLLLSVCVSCSVESVTASLVSVPLTGTRRTLSYRTASCRLKTSTGPSQRSSSFCCPRAPALH